MDLLDHAPNTPFRRPVAQAFLARYRRAEYPLDAVLVYGLYTDNAGIKEGQKFTVTFTPVDAIAIRVIGKVSQLAARCI